MITTKYEGKDGKVYRNDKLLDPTRSQKVYNHSPDGFSWGYSGSGPAQLALAILLDVTNNPEMSLQLHQEYKSDVIARLPKDKGWVITRGDVLLWILDHSLYKE